jgi:hypothetical protein
MKAIQEVRRFIWLLVPLLGLIVLLGWAQTGENTGGTGSRVSADTAIRFFYHPAGSYFHAPLIIRVVGENDPQLITAPMSEAGRTTYIRLSEMKSLTQGLEHLEGITGSRGIWSCIRSGIDRENGHYCQALKEYRTCRTRPEKHLHDSRRFGTIAHDTTCSMGISEVPFELRMQSPRI